MAALKKPAPDEPEQPTRTPPGKIKILMAEFFDLQEQQWRALDRAVYLRMTAKEAQEYESRALRLNELVGALRENLTYRKDRPQNP